MFQLCRGRTAPAFAQGARSPCTPIGGGEIFAPVLVPARGRAGRAHGQRFLVGERGPRRATGPRPPRPPARPRGRCAAARGSLRVDGDEGRGCRPSRRSMRSEARPGRLRTRRDLARPRWRARSRLYGPVSHETRGGPPVALDQEREPRSPRASSPIARSGRRSLDGGRQIPAASRRLHAILGSVHDIYQAGS